jgi:hypothetical protein
MGRAARARSKVLLVVVMSFISISNCNKEHTNTKGSDVNRGAKKT